MVLHLTITKAFSTTGGSGGGGNSNTGGGGTGSVTAKAGNQLKSIACACNKATPPKIKNPLGDDSLGGQVVSKSDTEYSISAGNVDKRVALTVSPKTYLRNESLYAKRVAYILGTKKQTLYDKSTFYGLLRNALGTSSGLIFPYTPNVSFQHNVNYSTLDIVHSNLSYNYYKNTPPPTIGLKTKFTADNRDNALHMLSAIWFLTACSKCDFGENAKYAGLPPPVLYLNGYDHLIDNIPVVISSFGYSYPENKHYVNLVLDFTQEYKHTNNLPDETESGFVRIYNYATTDVSARVTDEAFEAKNLADSELNLPLEQSDLVQGTTEKVNVRSGNICSFWLPTEIDIDIQLKIQPNLLKTRKQWSLDKYKTGILITNKGKNPPVTIPGLITQSELSAITKLTQEGDSVGADTSQQDQQCVCEEDTSIKLGFIPSGWTW